MKNVIDLVGNVFGRLKVIEFAGRKNKHSMFKCICDCGNETVVTSNNLRRSHTKSCGCISDESIVERSITHGLSSHPLFDIWCGMRNRCYYEKHNRRHLYAGRGIIVCDE